MAKRDLIKYFFQLCDIINNNEDVPYHLEIKIVDIVKLLTIDEISDIIHYILAKQRASDIIRYLSHIKVSKYIFYIIEDLKYIPQRKSGSKDAFEHTLRVIEKTPADHNILRWVALLHDTGKIKSLAVDYNFHNHARYSRENAEIICKVFHVPYADDVCTIVENHMYPLDYQRQPDWTNTAIRKFINRCGNKEIALDTVLFSTYDKAAEHPEEEYVKTLEELYERIVNIDAG